jgi:hypothetical protein
MHLEQHIVLSRSSPFLIKMLRVISFSLKKKIFVLDIIVCFGSDRIHDSLYVQGNNNTIGLSRRQHRFKSGWGRQIYKSSAFKASRNERSGRLSCCGPCPCVHLVSLNISAKTDIHNAPPEPSQFPSPPDNGHTTKHSGKKLRQGSSTFFYRPKGEGQADHGYAR